MGQAMLLLGIIFALLQFSSCTYDCVRGCACEKMNGILTADCRGLNFTYIPPADPRYQVNILLLQFNLITKIHAGDFFLYSNLKELSLQGNRIASIDENAFDRLPRLEKLDLSNNVIKTVPESEMLKISNETKWISFSNNALRHIPGGLANMTRLEYLDLSSNKFIEELEPGTLPYNLIHLNITATGIKNFQKESFLNLTSLRTLLITDNTASVSVRFGKRVFDDLMSLELIDLSRTFCKRLPQDSFSTLKNLTTLIMNNCWLSQPPLLKKLPGEVDKETEFSTLSVSTTAVSTSATTSNIDTTYETTPESSTGEWYNPKLEVLDLSNNRRMKMDNKKVSFSPSLKELRLRYTSIPSVDEDMFKEAHSIQKLDLSYSRLKCVEPLAFISFKNLSEITLDGNPLTEAPHLPSSLVSVNLRRTKIVNITQTTFRNLFNAVQLNLQDGEVDWIEDFAFANMTALEKLDLSHNKIHRLSSNALSIGRESNEDNCRNQLLEINLSDNLLNDIDRRAFSTLKLLMTLNLEGNLLEVVEERLFEGLNSLTSLNLKGNLIVDITPSAFTGLSNVQDLDLEDNKIEILYSGTLDSMTNLSRLYLKNNKLTRIHYANLPALTFLDLSVNNLTSIPIISGRSMTEMKLSHNMIQEITAGTFDNVPKLKILDLGHCELEIVDYSALAKAGSLQSLDLTDNEVETFIDVTMSSLEYLLLNENNIHAIPVHLKDVTPRLKSLEIAYNNISTLDLGIFSNMDDLTGIDLYGNDFQCDCDLVPFVDWIKHHLTIVKQAEHYTCVRPTELYQSLVINIPSSLNCTTNTARIYAPVAGAVALLAIILIVIACFIRRRSSRGAHLREERNGGNNANDTEVKLHPSSATCCTSCKNWFGGSRRDYRERAESEERRDLMISSPVTSPMEKEPPTSL